MEVPAGALNKNYKYYSHYTRYRMMSTIQLSTETKKKIASFGTKEETYEDIIKRIYNMAVKEQLREFMMDTRDYISLDEARKMVNE